MYESLVLFIILGVMGIIIFVYLFKRNRGQEQSIILFQAQIDSMRDQVQKSLEAGNQNLNQQMSSVTKLFVDTIGQINSRLSEQMQTISESVSLRLKENIDVIQKTQSDVGVRLDSTSKVISDIRAKMGEMEESNRQIFEIGKDLTQLQNLLRAPKFRGGMAEFMLSELLAQILPSDFYSLQHTFKTGRVDAVIRLGDGLIPIDAKFPLGEFSAVTQSDGEDIFKVSKKQFMASVKKHIDDIAKKYILPEEGTYDFAMMYIPAENVYYETIIKDENGAKSILEYALNKKVIPVSPNSFYAYLQTILLGLKGMKIEQQAKIIIQNLQQLQGNFNRFENEFQILGKHLNNAFSKFRDLEVSLSRFGNSISRIDSESSHAGLLPPEDR